MKRLTGLIVICLLASGVAFMATATDAQARFRGGSGGQSLGQGPNYVDANGDGICDWAQNRRAWDQTTRGQYGQWVDANGDGVCDNYGTRPQDGTGRGYRGGR